MGRFEIGAEAKEFRLTGCRVASLFLLIFLGNLLFPVDGHTKETATVISSRLNMRPGPGTENPPIMVLKKGTTVQVIERREGWLKIRYLNRSGWVKNRSRYLRISGKPESVASQSENAAIDRAKKKVEKIEKKIRSAKAEVVTVTRKERDLVDGLNQIDLSLNRAGKQLTNLESEFAKLTQEMKKTKTAIAGLSQKLSENRAYASRRLVALYKLDRIGKIHFLASAESFHDLFLRETSLKRVLAQDLRMLADLSAHRRDLNKLHGEQKMQIAGKHVLEEKLKKQMAIMGRERSRRKKLLAEIRGKKSLQLAALQTFQKAAEDLNEKIRDLHLNKPKPKPPKPLPETRQKPVKAIPPKSFGDLKGLLKMPVEGKIISRFGPYQNREFNVRNFRSGIEIRADRGEPIRAVSVGRVIYANWFKGYGNMMIIDHGAGYYTVYANIEELFKKSGDQVETGEVVATVGDSGAETDPKLYFEIRRESKPVDPLKWVKKG